ncbi:hypothetical protein [Aureimonas sp. Leaf324]|jgi:hypothetical protein|uniref:hypothetical protein n=1 Tax=Aureimonas sp. Leaf324 TaxID=1736336 RepID=UPI000B32AEAC|nr:hypothetical protein [Aureimonas sp. Leaf324]
MKSEAKIASRSAERAWIEHVPVRDEMRAARGLFVGLALSAIIWLALLVTWLAW